ncbi:uncharacterized protein MELLADRAFT_92070 [Melampsora larici-populina 98AG31]|uniref:GCM domain-containing protein n=1 Tax=Melampsora larici-populina (strain 98AG31 / pathotype 3-4-7) TaxID=747676 RepID=F4S1F0_MELLP|nr:uncharacterized protein MELLADRAFT_92070 [Melampsora larici-populina 98AG31]EGG01552.1 hypothetical protein MELLADRAFT_92070 [Melampsora larici-populina 98AG31]
MQKNLSALSFKDKDDNVVTEKGLPRRPNLQLPTNNKDTYRTFIDHGCEVDEEDYPTYPNGATVYVNDPERPASNFRFIAWTHTMRTETTKKKDWITRRYYCLGVMKCSEDECPFAGSPPTGKKKIAEVVDGLIPCPVSSCDGYQIHTDCNAVCRIDVELDDLGQEQWGILRHQGTHHHQWPESKKADPISKAKLKEKVLSDIKTGPLGLKVGQVHSGTEPIQTVLDIHPSFGHTDRLGYLRRDFLEKAGIMTNTRDPEAGDKWLQTMMDWSRKGLIVPSSSIAGDNAHISFQTEWMAKVLVEPDEKSDMYTGGLLSDYCEPIKRWVPVLFTWLGGLSTEHYKIHFTVLLQQIQKTNMSDKNTGMMVEQVVNFSTAQKAGFVEAYMEVFHCHDKNVALSKLHGCEWHFLQAVTRLKKNSKIVKPQSKGTWEKKCKALLQPDGPGVDDLDTRFEELRRMFPLAKRWLEWWATSDIQAMLFPARKRMPQDDPPLPGEDSEDKEYDELEPRRRGPRRRPDLPSTTNAQESMHRVYYILWANARLYLG